MRPAPNRFDTRAQAIALVLLMFSCIAPKEACMAAQTANLYLLEDLEDVNKSKPHTKSERAALRNAAAGIRSFVTKPHKDLGREGAVCPFVPGALERKTL